MGKTRTEKDAMGPMEVPVDAGYGASTARAVQNFPVSGIRMPRRFIRALGLIKKCAAEANRRKGDLEAKPAEAIVAAAQEVIDGTLDAQFPVDVFQTGSGTSSNMNANEVIAHRASQICDTRIHPNDDVNRGQSSNDVVPTAIHIATVEGIDQDLVPALRKLHAALDRKAEQFDAIVKIGRTHLQDAVPVRLGQEFGGYAAMVANGIARVEGTRPRLLELALGGTAVGTGLNADPEFVSDMIRRLAETTGTPFVEAPNHFEAQGAQDALVETSGALKTVACSLMKIANDIRWLGSGPRVGLGEITIPPIQPGSSIMPGKVNPVICESVMQVGAQVIGNDAAVTVGGHAGGVLELNVMMPMMAHNLLQSIMLLANVSTVFVDNCIERVSMDMGKTYTGIEADKAKCLEGIEKSLAMCTALAPHIGYDAAKQIAAEAFASGRTVREVAAEKKVLDPKKLEEALDAMRQTGPRR